ncbi:MAG: DUF3306 domain-containing protein [Burkholderiales bacterium]|nr:DUF3306 domain-containing protein [Burkholderiales bacterium]
MTVRVAGTDAEGLTVAVADDPKTPEPFSLSRWSRRKLDAARGAPPAAAVAPAAVDTSPASGAVAPTVPSTDTQADAPLPPVATLTIESDFSVFMRPQIDEDVKHAALKKLFSDSRFNVMDGLDIYTGDYTQSDPMPAGMLAKLDAVYTALASDEQHRTVTDGEVVAADAAASPPIAGSTPTALATADADASAPTNIDTESPAYADAVPVSDRKKTS